ncbi:MAG TPA: hypothetical protein VH497_09250 [Vicinamibacterales bacterium]
MRSGKLVERHGTRLVEPAEVGGEISEARFDQYPAARLGDLTKSLERRRIDSGRRRVCQAIEIGVGIETEVAGDCAGSGQELDFRRVPTDRRQQRQLLERPL